MAGFGASIARRDQRRPGGPPAWHAAHGEAIIIAAEYRWGGLSVKYTGYHPDFEELPEGVMEPEYECVLERTRDAAGTISFIATWKQVGRTP